ncbi:MAG: ORF6N domain-containing protein [Candidatus Falkowbacteria bacterium]
MPKEKTSKDIINVPEERIIGRIFLIRGKKVMLSGDLSDLYNVEIRALNQAVKRNYKRFPPDFMFQLNKSELTNLKSQFVISSWGGSRYEPYAFTEQGVAMLSCVLKSKTAVEVSINIMRTFIRLRELALNNQLILDKIDAMEVKYDKELRDVFEVLRSLLIQEDEKPKKEEIGFKL